MDDDLSRPTRENVTFFYRLKVGYLLNEISARCRMYGSQYINKIVHYHYSTSQSG